MFKTAAVFLGVIILAAALCTMGCKKKQAGSEETSYEDSLAAKYGKGSEVIQNLNKDIEKEPENPELYYRRANQWAKEQNPVKALLDIKRAVALSPQNALFRFSMGEIAFMGDSITLAYSAFSKATQLKPDFVDAFVKLGELQYILHQHPESIATFERVEELEPTNASVWYYKGRNFIEMKDTAQAIENLKNAVEVNSDYYEAYIELGKLFFAKGGKNLKTAEDYYTNAIRIKELSAEALYARAVVYYDMNVFDKSIRDYEKVIAINPDDYRPYSGAGLINFNLDRYEEAISYYDKALMMNPDFARGYYLRGLAYFAKNDYPAARKDFEATLKLDPSYKQATEFLKQIKQKGF